MTEEQLTDTLSQLAEKLDLGTVADLKVARKTASNRL